jgi:N,N'-diacetyllegionaminate synthase
VRIGNHLVDIHQPPFVIAEIGQGHDGSLGNALNYIDMAKSCGADAVKFQTHIAREESTAAEDWRVKFSKQDPSRFDYWRRTEFTFAQWRMLKDRADDLGIAFLSSPFSILACEWLDKLGVQAWKLASGEVHNEQTISWLMTNRKPVIISSGLSSVRQSISLVKRFEQCGIDAALLHCTSNYPAAAEHIGLNIFSKYKKYLSVPIGLSDHSGTIYPSVIASYLGASIIEVHLTWHKGMFGPDTSSSLAPDQLSELVRGVNFAFRMRSNPVDKQEQLERLSRERSIFGRSLVAARNIEPGTTLCDEDLSYKKPAGGIPFERRELLVGKRTRVPLRADQMLTVDDVY